MASTPNAHWVKLRVRLRLRAETTVSDGWIAERLRMRTPTHLEHSQ